MKSQKMAAAAATSLLAAMIFLPAPASAQAPTTDDATKKNGDKGGNKPPKQDKAKPGHGPGAGPGQGAGPGAGPGLHVQPKPSVQLPSSTPPNVKVEKHTPPIGSPPKTTTSTPPNTNKVNPITGQPTKPGTGPGPGSNPIATDHIKKHDKNKNPVVINPGSPPITQQKGTAQGQPNTRTPLERFNNSPTPLPRQPAVQPGTGNPLDKARTTGGPPRNNPIAAGQPKSFEELKRTRTEKTFGGGKGTVIEEADKRRIFKSGNTVVIQHDETERLRNVAPNARFEKGKGGTNVSIIERPGNVRIYNETDANGQLIRRYRRGPDGRDEVIIDNRRRKHSFGKDIAIGAGIGLGVAAGAAILNSFVDVPPPRVRIPRDRYIVDYDRASDDDVYEALSAPPVEDAREGYSLDEIRATVALRDRMRRVDLDDITFEFGSYEVDPGQYGKLERIARAMQRVIDRNPNEVFMIEGYTDSVGSREDNLSLSDRRAESVAEVLTREFRIPYENLTTQGYGEDYLKVQTDGPERLNRRVAVRRITPLLSRNDRASSPPPPRDDQGGVDDQNGGYDDRGPPPDDRRDGPDDQGPPPDDRGGGNGQYQYSPYRNGDQPN